MKKGLLLILSMLFFVSWSWAQERSVTGTVTNTDGEVLPGVNVVVKNSSVGTVTNVDGAYSINVPSDGGILVFSFIGFQSEEVEIGNRSVVDVSLSDDVKQLGEVVVTAQAVERGKRELGFAVSKVDGAELTKARETNIVNSLAGKVAGVQVTSSGGSVGASTNILIRGISSLSGDNQPLFVVDGVPISNANIAAAGSGRITGNIDTGNRASDINPDDVESISVLKGAAAAALYGSRARNGVIMVTTKRGQRGEGTIEFNSSLRFDNVLRLPDYQNEFAQGEFGKYNVNSVNGWGPRIEGQLVEDFRGDSINLQAFPDNIKDFYETGVTAINSLSFANANENNDYRLGVTHLDQQGVVPNSDLERLTFSLNAGNRISPKVHSRLTMNYARTTSQGRPAQGGNDPNVLTEIINSLPRTFDLSGRLRDYINPDGTQNALSNFTNNPYWVANENLFTNELDRIYGSATITYDPVEKVSIMNRLGTDFYNEFRRRISRKGTIGRENGEFYDDQLMQSEINNDLIITYQESFGQDFKMNLLGGYNINQRTFRNNYAEGQELTVDGLYAYGNSEAQQATNDYSQRRLHGVYGDLTLSYRDYLYLQLTGRNDWSSTLPKNNNSYFYPSANLSFVLSDALQLPSDVLSFAKLRANYAQVGSDEAPYQLNFRYFPITGIFGQYSTGNNFPYGGQTSFISTATIPPTDLQPEIQTQIEFGTEVQLFEGLVGIDLTYYDITTRNQIISIPIPISTGFNFRRTNVGVISNKGIEALLTVTPIRTPNFNWEISANFARNVNRIEKLADDVEDIVIQSAFNGVQIKAEEGKTLGLYGVGWRKDTLNGAVRPVVDPNTGLRISGETERFGDVVPEFRLGLMNTFSFKGLTLSFLLDWQEGGVIYSSTIQDLRNSGVAAETAVNREGGFTDTDAVIVEDDGTVRQNDVAVSNMQSFWENYASASVAESNVFDASYLKLREVMISYSLPTSLINKTPFQQVRLGLEGRNLALLMSNIPHIDPETNLFGSGANGAGIDFNNVPSTRTYGFNLNLTF
ncbi:MAG: SusC/RagA family TonB-linked outer membrane protein [Cyclobacteriaceae bacterium]